MQIAKYPRYTFLVIVQFNSHIVFLESFVLWRLLLINRTVVLILAAIFNLVLVLLLLKCTF